MTDVDGKIDRLLRAAALAKEEAPLDAPFGFDTRVVALWRAKEKAASLGLVRLVRRVAHRNARWHAQRSNPYLPFVTP